MRTYRHITTKCRLEVGTLYPTATQWAVLQQQTQVSIITRTQPDSSTSSPRTIFGAKQSEVRHTFRDKRDLTYYARCRLPTPVAARTVSGWLGTWVSRFYLLKAIESTKISLVARWPTWSMQSFLRRCFIVPSFPSSSPSRLGVSGSIVFPIGF